MFLLLVALSALLAPTLSRPQESAPVPSQAAKGVETPPIPILNQSDEANPDGSFQFSYETGNGIKVEEKGYVKDGQNASEKIQVIEGTVTYTDTEGNVINLKYIADENGYRPVGDHIPQALGAPQTEARSGKSLPVQSVVQTAAPAVVEPKVAEIPTAKPAEEPSAAEPAPQPTA